MTDEEITMFKQFMTNQKAILETLEAVLARLQSVELKLTGFLAKNPPILEDINLRAFFAQRVELPVDYPRSLEKRPIDWNAINLRHCKKVQCVICNGTFWGSFAETLDKVMAGPDRPPLVVPADVRPTLIQNSEVINIAEFGTKDELVTFLNTGMDFLDSVIQEYLVELFELAHLGEYRIIENHLHCCISTVEAVRWFLDTPEGQVVSPETATKMREYFAPPQPANFPRQPYN